ncbi:SDR family oxidoreductase [Rhizobium lemnae]|uniref:SDR family NAD(P)-dependent oxidoreductase n=1 Tax=Rhizobium lemnae TaxID=1214924 RepID=A0ABV8EAD4_9HYPH|nr:SDR family oxidoreductase [Rhizobium lemnae]MCJ8507158.1 SDR family oxidoreductase [Rhizobium lemnae]
MGRVFITGVSDGIGLALAALYLEKGWDVFGTARSVPHRLLGHENFHFKSCDLGNPLEIANLLSDEFAVVARDGVNLVYLNAGISGGAPRHGIDVKLADLSHTLMVNALANKLLVDMFLSLPVRPDAFIASASIAGQRFRAGMLPYSMSKAALLALLGTYAQEYPDIFFLPLGLCNVDTNLAHSIVFSDRADAFPAHVALQQRFSVPGYVVKPDDRARDIFSVVHSDLSARLTSGEFVEIRHLLASTEAKEA